MYLIEKQIHRIYVSVRNSMHVIENAQVTELLGVFVNEITATTERIYCTV